MYSLKDLYPNLGTISTREVTLPEREEQKTLAQVDEAAPYAVDAKTSIGLWAGIALIVVALAALHLI